jgi:hypothetical protein
MRNYFLFLLTFWSLAVFGSTQNVLTISSDIDPVVSQLSVGSSASGALQRIGIVGRLNGDITSNRTFTLTQLRNGVVVEHKDGRDIVIFKAHNFHETYGGRVEVQFMVNGLTRSYNSLSFDLIKDGGKWVASLDGRTITSLRLHGNRKMGKVIGIARISH